MELSTPLSITSNQSSSDSEAKDENLMVVPATSKRDKFFATCQSQDFSLPDSVMFYITKNPSTPEVYQKMIQSCKDFFIKNPILVAFDFSYSTDDLWSINFGENQFDIVTFACKFWITNQLIIEVKNNVNQNPISSLIPKLHRCDAKVLNFENLSVSFADLLLLISSAERIDFSEVTVIDEKGSNVVLEKIVEVAVKAKRILVLPCTVTSKTMKELIKIPHFSKLDGFTLYDIPETFDLETFYGYMKKNQNTYFWLIFDASISEAYKTRVEKIVDEILATETFDYKPPIFHFDGLDREKEDELADIFNTFTVFAKM